MNVGARPVADRSIERLTEVGQLFVGLMRRQRASRKILASTFGYLIYSLEVIIGVSLLLGLFVRATSTVGALLILNIYFGLYRSQAVWPWTYAFLVVLMVLFAVERYGRSLGADALLSARQPRTRGLAVLVTVFT